MKTRSMTRMRRGGRAAWAGALPLSCALLAGPAMAQSIEETAQARSGEETGEEIVVTASRIRRDGFVAPTPTTVVGPAELAQGGRTNIANVLADIPQFRSTDSPTTTTTTTNTGSATADLRGLGSVRTLVLINGRRPISSGSGGTVDLNDVPFSLVERVEVVTGGASAAWGSGAVAGVVNIILDDRRKGLDLTAQYGVSSRGDGDEYKLGGSFGTDFADGRGHLSVAADYVETSAIRPKTSRSRVGRWALIRDPDATEENGQPLFVTVPNVGFSILSRGGLILSGPLAGQQFLPGGALAPFGYGAIVSGAYTTSDDAPSFDTGSALSAPVRRISAYGRATYALGEDIRLSFDASHADVRSVSDTRPDSNFADLLIRADNAFLPAAVRAAIVAPGQDPTEAGFIMGRYNADFGLVRADTRRRSTQGTIGLDGSLGEGWKWDAYYTYGVTRSIVQLQKLRIASNFLESVDSVIHPMTGQPICRSALTVPSTACVPINLFGEGAPSAEALRYIQGDLFANTRGQLHVAAASIRGEPFSLWAGPVSIAAGAEWRRESARLTIDPLSAGLRFASINASGLSGGVSVREGFFETVVPLVKDAPLLKALELNGAVRFSDYSTSGGIFSWKIGLTNQVTDDLRLRATRSRDIRSPNVSELFSARDTLHTSIFDPVKDTQVQIVQFTGGNRDLKPETANTLTLGTIYSPKWAPGLNLSVDYYSIDISGAIKAISAQDIVNRCVGGNADLCGLIARDGAGNIVSTNAALINLARFEARGIDFELSYETDLTALSSTLPGRIQFRLIANHVDKYINDDGVSRIDALGDLGSEVLAVPRWRGVASATYSDRDLTVNLRARYVGSGAIDKNLSIANNHIDARTYVDLGFEYRILSDAKRRLSWFGNVNNLFDRAPPLNPNPVHYDIVGRYFTTGIRASF
ncbi:MAG: TonB-dependent receptor plug domain-containing protein [Sphingobium sp.]